MANEVLVVDLEEALGPGVSRTLLDSVRRNAEEVGIVQVVNHGIPDDLVVNLHERIERLLDLPWDQRAKLISPTGHPFRGWTPYVDDGGKLKVEQFNVSQFDSPEEAVSMGLPEKYAHFYAERNIWPTNDTGLAEVTCRYRDACVGLASLIVNLYAKSFGLSAGVFPISDRPYDVGFSANRYPAWLREDRHTGRTDDDPRVLMSEHVDTTILTVLYQSDDHPGLQVKTAQEEWILVPTIAGALQIATGQVLSRWTNGRLRSSPHRVVAADAFARLSTGVFWRPSLRTVVEPLTPFVEGRTPEFQPLLMWDARAGMVENYLRSLGQPGQLEAWYKRHPFVPKPAEAQ